MDQRQETKDIPNIFLIGFMGCGKSTVAKYMKEQYGMHYVEMDKQIEEEQGMSISRIFAEKGEESFRKMETELLGRLEKSCNQVVSCGGGAAMRECNVELMKKNGRVVLLTASPLTIYNRVKNTHNRPLLEGNMNVDYIRGLMEARMPRYLAAADIVVETDRIGVAEIGRKIMEEL